jgi:DNA-binding MarR family transcriptional regulator
MVLLMAPVPTNIPDCTIFLLAKAYQKAHGRFKVMLRPYELTNLQHLVLEGLWYQQGVTAAELGKLLVLDKATLSGILDRMIDAGWILKNRDPDDKRLYRLFTTEKANNAKQELIDLRIKANEELLDGFTDDERVLFKRLLRALT